MPQAKKPFRTRFQLLLRLTLNAGKHPGNQPVRRSRLFGQLPGRNKLKAGSRLLVSPFPEIKFILSCCGVL
jgi:hypothetical protein